MPWAAANATSVSYKIGESPELPEEAHILLPDGTASDFYGGLRSDDTKAAIWDNKFWTGSRSQTSGDIDDKNIGAGLIGLVKKYEDRDNRHLIFKNTQPLSPYFKVWATTLS